MPTDIVSILIFLAIGLVAGWLAGLIVKGHGFGLFGNMIVGVIGAFVGAYVLGFFGIALGGIIGSIIGATVGAALLLFVIGLIKRV